MACYNLGARKNGPWTRTGWHVRNGAPLHRGVLKDARGRAKLEAKRFRIRTSEKLARKCRRIRTYKNIGLKVL
jgi:hypothetical protein